jgi:hypothetical protein
MTRAKPKPHSEAVEPVRVPGPRFKTTTTVAPDLPPGDLPVEPDSTPDLIDMPRECDSCEGTGDDGSGECLACDSTGEVCSHCDEPVTACVCFEEEGGDG